MLIDGAGHVDLVESAGQILELQHGEARAAACQEAMDLLQRHVFARDRQMLPRKRRT